MKNPFFTIIMPTYNQAKFIETSLKSIFSQDIDSYELLVYDALSSDGTSKILEKYKGKLIWHREKDSGMSEALNKGLLAGKGEVFAWLCSDDVYLPHVFSRVMNAFQKNPELDFVYGDALEIDSKGNIVTPNLFTEDYDANRYLFSHNYMCQPTVFFRKHVFNRVGMIDEDDHTTMDYEWFARFYMAGLKAKRLPFFLAANRDRPETKTNASGISRYRNMIRVHALRLGRPLILRKSFWVYSFEAVIKAINKAANNSHSKEPSVIFLRKISSFFGSLFLLLVNPKSREDIIHRYFRDIVPHGNNINDQWASHNK